MEAFDDLKQRIGKAPVLALYNPKAETEVHTDASSRGLSGLLLQKGPDGQFHLMYAVSKQTTAVEKMYHSSRLELMAMVWTIDRSRSFLLDIQFTMVTNCQALMYLNAHSTKNPQIDRWADLLQEYQFTIKHRPGARMAHVDAMSRAPVEKPSDTWEESLNRRMVFIAMTEEEYGLAMQMSDPDLRQLAEILRRPISERSREEKNRSEGFKLVQQLILRKEKVNDKRFQNTREISEGDVREQWRIVVPKPMRKSIVVRYLDLRGHFAVDRTVNEIKRYFWFPKMKRYVRRHISMCPDCVLTKCPAGKVPGELHPIPPGTRPFDVIHVDHLGPFVRSRRGRSYLLVITDNFTRYTQLCPSSNTKAMGVVKSLEGIFKKFGIPKRVTTDRGTAFTAQCFKEYCSKLGVKHTLNSPRHPQGNGMVVRVNRVLVPMLQATFDEGQEDRWDYSAKPIRNFTRVSTQI